MIIRKSKISTVLCIGSYLAGKLLLIYFLFSLPSCGKSGEEKYNDLHPTPVLEIKDLPARPSFQIYPMDSCEYIGSAIGGYSGLLTHKGNCKFCKARNLNQIAFRDTVIANRHWLVFNRNNIIYGFAGIASVDSIK